MVRVAPCPLPLVVVDTGLDGVAVYEPGLTTTAACTPMLRASCAPAGIVLPMTCPATGSADAVVGPTEYWPPLTRELTAVIPPPLTVTLATKGVPVPVVPTTL